ncbi:MULTISPECIES: YciI family protein [unclassified Paenibacillus]|uniref:YciI family protein n=1 Tax=unclassified Paenibacillus TaxID=185978 RepID=UPI00095493AA|nr:MULTISPECIES: YciI family protein [unclassified Paenibacillus]ASS68314.1 hypothetical protein CIC07_20900 [Paenibacillus sp. RUD330]SIR28635.1 hypothetical protein SAMN05880555_3367 [Paenibacillus sp. RU4X]SIR40940.1 hypothetical protein SAMN05880570_3368 [Paenibacillus sp. RU4T]
MAFFAVMLPMLDEEKSARLRTEHLAYLEKLEQEGRIAARGRFTDGWGGLVIYTGESLQQVSALVEQDPYVLHQARNYEIHPWEMTSLFLKVQL